VGFSAVTSTDFNFSASRFNSNGTIDLTFGTNGTAIINTGSGADEAYSVCLDASGRIYIAGLIWNGAIRNMGIVRLTSNGTPDNTWDGDGVWYSQTLYGEYLSDIAIDANGKIVVCGHGGLNDDKLIVLRLNSNATYDGTFGTGGKVEMGSTGNDEGVALAFDSNNRILVGGREEFTVIRLNTNGTADATFGTGGSITINPTSNSDELGDITVDANGNIVVMGHGGLTLQADYIAARLNPNGNLDNTFGNSGISIISAGVIQDQGRSVAIDANGRILLSGESTGPNGTDFSVVRLNTNGSTDNSFGTNGIAILSGLDPDNGYGMSIDLNGKILVAGIGSPGNNTDFYVVRLNSSNATGIAGAPWADEIRLYPLPFCDLLNMEGLTPGDVVQLTDLTGKGVLYFTCTSSITAVDLSFLQPGIYFASFERSGRIENRKLVKI
jgi:uncharacterized delta-60 repeat protein